jgi:hypothetical protein
MTTELPDTHPSAPAPVPLALKSNLVLGPNALAVERVLRDMAQNMSQYGMRTKRGNILLAAAEIERLREAESDFHMEYRLKCDVETKAQAQEIERLRAMLAEVLPVAWTGGDGMPAAHQDVMDRAKAMLDLGPNVRIERARQDGDEA